MRDDFFADEALAQRLPMPLAQLYRRAHNAKSVLERHNTAFFLWEASLKLLGSVAIAQYAERLEHDPQFRARLSNLARPALGHWWEFVRRLVPVLAEQDDAGFLEVRDLLLGKTRDDLPRAAGLDAALCEALDGKKQARATVNLAELYDRLVRYRNQEIGHGAIGRRTGGHYAAMSGALLAGIGEVLNRLDCLAGRRLLAIADVRRQPSGEWLVERTELVGEMGRRIESLVVPAADAHGLPRPQLMYAEGRVGSAGARSSPVADVPAAHALVSLHPLVIHDADEGEVLFLNSRRGRRRVEYLAYSSGRVLDRTDLAGDQRALLASVLGLDVDEAQAEALATRSQAEEPAGDAAAAIPRTRQIGEFELLSELGRGGMGVVYRAWQPSLGRQVALKQLQRSGDAKAELRFAREIRALGRVEHAHLAKIFTSGSDGEHWFYAMELIEGATLAAVCERLQSRPGGGAGVDAQTWHEALSTVCEHARRSERPLSGLVVVAAAGSGPAKAGTQAQALGGRSYVRHVVGLIAQVAQAAHALHQAGIVHRDIKPGNIQVTEDGLQAVLMDLGLAQLMDDADGRLTRTRQFVGTLRYASPQQVLAVGRLDRKSDVYSLGATLWEALALQPLFGATDQTPTPVLMEQIQREEPRRLRQLHRGLPRDLEAIAHKCLEKTPDRRYATAHDLARDLERFLDGKPVQARPVREWERAWKWVKRRPALAALTGSLAACIIGAIVALGAGYLELAQANADLEGANQTIGKKAEETREANAGLAQANGNLEKANQEIKSSNANLAKSVQEARGAAEEEKKARDHAEGLLATSTMMLARSRFEEGQAALAEDLLAQILPKYRRAPWGLLKNYMAGSLFTLHGHTRALTSVAYAPDGQVLASASDDETVKLWDARTGLTLRTLRGHKGVVTSVAFAADGQSLASASEDATIKLWDARTGQELRTLTGHKGDVTSVAFAADGEILASASTDQTVKLWDARTGQELRTLDGKRGTVRSVAFAARGQVLAWANSDKTIKLCDARSGLELHTLTGHADHVTSVAFAADSQVLASASCDNTVKLWDVRTGQERRTLRGHTSWVTSVAFAADGQVLASASLDNTVKLWDVQTGQELRTLRGHAGRVASVAFAADGQMLASASEDMTAKLWDAQISQERRTLRGHADRVAAVALTVDGQVLATASYDKTVKLWDARTGKELRTLPGHKGAVTSVAFAADGKVLASASQDMMVKLWNARTGKELHMLRGHANTVTSVAFATDGKMLASASLDGTVKLWDARTGIILHTLRGHEDVVKSVAFAADGLMLASAGRDQTIKLWDTRTGRELRTLRGHTREVECVAFSADGEVLASAGGDQTIKLWDAETGQELRSLRGHTAAVMSVAFAAYSQAPKPRDEVLRIAPGASGAIAADSQVLASASLDKTVKLWDARTGQELRTLRGHTDRISSVALAAASQVLASASWDGTVKLWDARTGLDRQKDYDTSVAFAKDGKVMVNLRDARTKLELRTLHGHKDRVTSVAFAANGQFLASGSYDKTLKLWDVQTGRELHTLRGHARAVESVAFAADGQMLASASLDNTVKLWDTRTGQELRTLRGQKRHVSSVAFSADGKTLWGRARLTVRQIDADQYIDANVTLGMREEFIIMAWDAAIGEWRPVDAHIAFAPDGPAARSPDGNLLAVGRANGLVLLVPRAISEQERRFRLWVTAPDFHLHRELAEQADRDAQPLALAFRLGRYLAAKNYYRNEPKEAATLAGWLGRGSCYPGLLPGLSVAVKTPFRAPVFPDGIACTGVLCKDSGIAPARLLIGTARALEGDAMNWRNHALHGGALLRNGEPAKALAALTEAVKLNGKPNPLTHNFLGLTQLALGQFDEARDTFAKARAAKDATWEDLYLQRLLQPEVDAALVKAEAKQGKPGK